MCLLFFGYLTLNKVLTLLSFFQRVFTQNILHYRKIRTRRYRKTFLIFQVIYSRNQEFIAILNDYLIWYREKRIKLSLGGLSPMEYRRSLGLTWTRYSSGMSSKVCKLFCLTLNFDTSALRSGIWN